MVDDCLPLFAVVAGEPEGGPTLEAETGTGRLPVSRAKPVRREMTADERVVVPLLAKVGYSVGSWDKRFAREIQYVLKEGLITEGQSVQVWRIFKRYRRQIVCAEKERLLGWADEVLAAAGKVK